jgi:hypothetical protein
MKTYLFPVLLVLAAMAMADDKMLPLPNSGNVTLTLDEYNRLIEMAAKPPKKSDAPPLAYSIKHADMKLHIEDGVILGTVQLDGEVFRKGISKVPLSAGMTIFDAHSGVKSVPMQLENGTQTALLPGSAEFSVALDAGLPLRIEAGRASFTVPVPSAGSVQLNLIIPGDHTVANISPGLITNRKSENGHTMIEATLVPGQPANIWWATRETATPVAPREVRFLSELKTLVSVSEADIRIASLVDITVVQGEPTQFQLVLPAGYEFTGATGASLESSEVKTGVLTLKVNYPSLRAHEFLISLEKSISQPKAEAPFLTFKGAQRETGEVLVEGAGTIELTATEGGGLKRMDVKETNPYLRSLAHFPPQAAFRYHKQPSQTPTLALEWVRFPDSSVLAAVAENAVITTLVTSEGRSLTEVKLTIKNQAQPFLKITLPAGATILSADVAGERVKPVEGPDGNRVPLLRPGFRPTDSYTVSFVFMHSGAPFAKKGGAELILPNMDIPISLMQWEVFLPERYKVKDFGGDVIASNLVPATFNEGTVSYYSVGGLRNEKQEALFPGQLGGVVTDPSGAVIPNARVTVTHPESGVIMTALTDEAGRWVVSHFPSGQATIKADSPGFQSTVQNFAYDASAPAEDNLRLSVGTTAQSVTVEATGAMISTNGRNSPDLAPLSKNQAQEPSANVMNLQRRVAGVLPIAIDVPRAGTSFSFVRPLVLNEETKVTFSYKSR